MTYPTWAGIALLVATWQAWAETDWREMPDQPVPVAVKPFVEPGMRALYLDSEDLNGDGRQDHVLVLEHKGAAAGDAAVRDKPRILLLLLGRPDGSLTLAKRNDKLVYCMACGGMLGDPFQGVEVGPKTFTVSHYGGSGWRWSVSYKFNYSRLDNTWQLVRVEEESFHAGNPEKVKRQVATPPKHFGKIDIADFDPDTWRLKK